MRQVAVDYFKSCNEILRIGEVRRAQVRAVKLLFRGPENPLGPIVLFSLYCYRVYELLDFHVRNWTRD